MKYSKYRLTVLSNEQVEHFKEINMQLQENLLDARIEDLERAIKTTLKLLADEKWANDLVLMDAVRKYKAELAACKHLSKQILLRKYDKQ